MKAPTDWAPDPLKLTVPVEQIKVPGVKSPPILSVPAPVNVTRDWAAVVAPYVILPLTLIVPMETDTVQYRPEVPLPGIAMLPAVSVPVPTAIVLVIVPVDGAFMIIAPLTVREFGLAIVTLVVAAGAFIVKLAHE